MSVERVVELAISLGVRRCQPTAERAELAISFFIYAAGCGPAIIEISTYF